MSPVLTTLQCALVALWLILWTWAYCEGFYATKARKSPPMHSVLTPEVEAAVQAFIAWQIKRDIIANGLDMEGDVTDWRAPMPWGYMRGRETVTVHIEADSDAEAVTAYLKQYGT